MVNKIVENTELHLLNEVQFLCFLLEEDGELYATNVFKVREVVHYTDVITKTEGEDNDVVLGFISMRGESIPLLDLRRWLYYNPESRINNLKEFSINSSKKLVVICEFSGYTVGLRIYSVKRIIQRNWSEVVTHNPDGEYNGWTKDGPGRTTLYSWAPGNQGIDMNRCFSVSYKREKGARNYNGTEPFQAYEAQALRDFILNNRGNQNIVIDVHGWLNETIGDNEIGGFYRNTFGISKHIGSYGSGYLVNWARSIGARSMLLELPPVYSHSQVVNNNYVSKFTNATMNLLRSF